MKSVNLAVAVILMHLAAVSTNAQTPAASDSAASTTPTFHVTSVHKERDNEKTNHTAFNELAIEGTVGNKKYTLEELDAFGAFQFEVGKDYPVVTASATTVKLTIPNKYDKHGKKPFRDETFRVITVEEIPAN
jgi:hypothetical protein